MWAEASLHCSVAWNINNTFNGNINEDLCILGRSYDGSNSIIRL